MAFEVVSIRLHAPGAPFTRPSFPISNENAYAATGGNFIADFSLGIFIQFAYKLSQTQDQYQAMLAHLPKWFADDRFVIRAKAANTNPTKDQMRLMMQSLLAERFHLAAHFENQTVPVFALVLAKPGKPGPNLRPHESGPPCNSAGGSRPQDKDVFPPDCETYMLTMQQNGTHRLGSRHTTMDLLASSIPTAGEVTRPVVDHTGLSGRFDFKLEWMHEANNATSAAGAGPAGPLPNDGQTAGPTFLEALNDQLGLKLEATKAPVPMLVIDHVERPSEN